MPRRIGENQDWAHFEVKFWVNLLDKGVNCWLFIWRVKAETHLGAVRSDVMQKVDESFEINGEEFHLHTCPIAIDTTA